MKKQLFIPLLISFVSLQAVQAQTFDEWFKQKKTQKKYLVQQIIALQTYLGYVKDGYKIVDRGLSTIGNITKGEFDLHDDFYASLDRINPVIKDASRVKGTMTYYNAIERGKTKVLERLRQESELTNEELQYLEKVYIRLGKECQADLEKLHMILADETLEMEDDDRLVALEDLHQAMQKKYEFLQAFTAETQLLVQARRREKTDINRSQNFYQIQ